MRHLLISTATWLMAAPLWAGQFTVPAPVSAVTLYPQGASVTRVIKITADAGAHEIIIPGLGENTDPASLRVTAAGAVIGAVSLQTGRAPPAEPRTSPDYEAARTRFEQLQAALGARDAEIATLRAQGQAATDRIDFMMKLAASDNLPVQDLTQIMDLVGAQILQARETAIRAETEARLAEQGRDREVEALERARRAVEALAPADSGQKALILAVEATGGPVQISMTSFDDMASWRPVYDIRLDRQAGQMVLDRGLLVSQDTGEDWGDVALTLSTARPMQQTAPATLSSWFPRLIDPVAPQNPAVARAAPEAASLAAMPAPMLKNSLAAESRWMGTTVVYGYPAPVAIRSGVDALRLRLDSRDLTPQIRATAVPQRDSSAFLVAEAVNTLDEVILPGQATLYADGVMVGQDDLDLVPAGETLRLGFGPIDGLIAEFEIPEQAEGDRGYLSRSNTSQQKTVLRLRNLTTGEWDLRIISQIPVPTQDDLKLSWNADPRPSGQDPDGQRGLIYWDQKIAPQQQQEVTLTTSLTWPEGKILQDATAPGQRMPPVRGVIR